MFKDFGFIDVVLLIGAAWFLIVAIACAVSIAMGIRVRSRRVAVVSVNQIPRTPEKYHHGAISSAQQYYVSQLTLIEGLAAASRTTRTNGFNALFDVGDRLASVKYQSLTDHLGPRYLVAG